MHPFILVPHREVLTLCLSAALKHFFGKGVQEEEERSVPWSGGAGEKPGRMLMCRQRVVFKSLFLGPYARRTHAIMNTHTQIHKEAEASPDLTHTHEHKYHSDQKPVRADRGPACARLGAVPSMPQRPGSPQTWLPGRPRLGALSRPEGFPGWRAPQEVGS